MDLEYMPTINLWRLERVWNGSGIQNRYAIQPWPLAILLRRLEYWGLRPATYAVTLPQPKPWARRQSLVMCSVSSGEIARRQRPSIGRGENSFQRFNFGDGLFNVHSRASAHQYTEAPAAANTVLIGN